jgi:hypothetical protein
MEHREEMIVWNIVVEIAVGKITFGRPGCRSMDRTDRIDLTVEDLIMQTGLPDLG